MEACGERQFWVTIWVTTTTDGAGHRWTGVDRTPRSSADIRPGRVPARIALQARCHWFEPSSAHQPKRPVSDLQNGA